MSDAERFGQVTTPVDVLIALVVIAIALKAAKVW